MSRRPAGIGAVGAGAFVFAIFAAAAAEAPKTTPPAPHPTAKAKPVDAKPPVLESVLRFLPKARAMSTYTLGVRFEIGTKDVTFEAPEAYKQGFEFWSGRMKGQRRNEVDRKSVV